MSAAASPPARTALDDEFDNRKAVGNSAQWLADWQTRSAALSSAWPALQRDIAYGGHPGQAIDVFLAQRQPAPTVVYVHGGYWQWNDRRQQAFAARGLLTHGVNVVFVGYRLAPEACMAEIVADVRSAVEQSIASLPGWGADPSGVYLIGASSGSQLAANALDIEGVHGALLMQGLYELAPLRGTYIDAALKLQDEEVRRYSPANHVDRMAKPVVLAVGGDELPRLKNASIDLYRALAARGAPAGLIVAAGHHHFSLLDELASDDGLLVAGLRSMMNGHRRTGAEPAIHTTRLS